MSAELHFAKCSFANVLSDDVVTDWPCPWRCLNWSSFLVDCFSLGCLLTGRWSCGLLLIICWLLVIIRFLGRPLLWQLFHFSRLVGLCHGLFDFILFLSGLQFGVAVEFVASELSKRVILLFLLLVALRREVVHFRIDDCNKPLRPDFNWWIACIIFSYNSTVTYIIWPKLELFS